MLGSVYTKIAYRCFQTCSSWTEFYNELLLLKQISLKNGYPKNFISKCFKRFIDNIHVVKETALEKKLEKELLDCSWRTTVQYL